MTASAIEVEANSTNDVHYPANWKTMRIGDVCELVNGNAYKPSDWSQSGVPIIRIQNLNDESKPFNYWDGPLDSKVIVRTGDILLAWSGTPGTSFGVHLWQRGDAVLNQHIFRVDLITPDVLPRWFVYVVNYKLNILINKAHGAVGLRHVTKGEVEKLEIPIPAISEQKRIVTILNEHMTAVERARVTAKAQLEAAKALPAAYLRFVFNSPKSREWPKKELGNICQFIGGSQPPKHTFKREKLPGYVRLVQIQDFRRTDVAVYIPQEEAKRAFDETDVMIGRYGPPVFQILRGLAGAYNVALMKASPKDGLVKEFLYYLLQEHSIQNAVIGQSERSAGQSGVQKEFLERFIVSVPEPSEQVRIAKTLDKQLAVAREVRKKLEGQLDTIKKMPSALLRRAFSGEL